MRQWKSFKERKRESSKNLPRETDQGMRVRTPLRLGKNSQRGGNGTILGGHAEPRRVHVRRLKRPVDTEGY